MPFTTSLSNFGAQSHKTILLYRFHVVVVIVNLLAIGIDYFSKRYANAFIELLVIIILLLNVWLLIKYNNLKLASYIFLFTLSIGLFTIIFTNQFASMSLLFVLLLPLTTILFIGTRASFFFELVLFFIMGGLLYLEYLNNPSNPLAQNPKALFNLGYTAGIIYIFGLLYHFYILKTFDELDDSNRQQKMLLSEVHHRVKNNLNIIASIIGLQSRRLKGEQKEELLKSKLRIESIAMVHEMLYEYEDFENINFNDYMQRLSTLILDMYGESKRITVEINAEKVKLQLEEMIHLGIITNELLTNSIKYAFDEVKGKVHISLKKEEDHLLYIYSDNGKGVEDTEKLHLSKSLGVKLIHLSSKQIKGKITMKNDNGLLYEIRFRHD